MAFKKITLINVDIPKTSNLNEKIQLFGGALGLFNLRDKNKSCFRIFITLLKHIKHGLTSDEIAANTSLTRGTVVYHLNKLIDSGIITTYKNRYLLNMSSTRDLITNLKKEIIKTLDELNDIAKDIDEVLRLK